MNFVTSLEQYNENFIFFCEPIKNNIMNDGNFIRILYSTSEMILNGIYLLVTINDFTCDKYYNKYRCCFNPATHRDLIVKMKTIEENILEKINIKDKIPQFKIFEQLSNGNIKIMNDITNTNSCTFILKVSGIWETQQNYGLTYKFIKTP
jgi:hypothetical protein